MVSELLDEAIRMRQAPGIAFTDGTGGRRAVAAGTGLELWQVVGSWLNVDRDFWVLVTEYPWLTQLQLNAAIAY